MRADRLLNILLMLQQTPRITAQEVATRLEVSPRTVHRDMEALSMAGIPVYAERGRTGGYALLDSFRADLHYLTRPEIQALFVNNLGVLRDLGLRQAAASGERKLRHALPPALGQDAERVRRHILVDGAGWRQTAEDHPCLTLVHDALWQGRQIHMTYTRADGSRRRRTVHPWGLVAKGRLWYLVAGVEDAPRTYRVGRIEDAEIAAEPAHIPADFDLASFWGESASQFVANLPRYPVAIWASPAGVQQLPRAGWYLQIEGYGETRADGWQQMQLVFHTAETAISCLVGFGDQIEVIEPAAVHSGIIELARRVLQRDQHSGSKL
ncbi:MAG: YafY family protein [Litorilinea sp.]